MLNKKTIILIIISTIVASAVVLAYADRNAKELARRDNNKEKIEKREKEVKKQDVVAQDNNKQESDGQEAEKTAVEAGDMSTSTEEIDTSDWQTYRNEEYGFEVKYPNGWAVSNSKDARFMIFNIEIREKALKAAKRMATEPLPFLNGIHFGISRKDESLEKFIQDKFNRDPAGKSHQWPIKLISKAETTFPNGMKAISVVCNEYGSCNYTLLESKNFIFQFSNYCSGNSFKLDTQEQCSQILSSFKFLD